MPVFNRRLINFFKYFQITLKPPTIGASGVGSGILDTNSIIEGLTPNTKYLVTVRAVQGDFVGNPAVIPQMTGNSHAQRFGSKFKFCLVVLAIQLFG